MLKSLKISELRVYIAILLTLFVLAQSSSIVWAQSKGARIKTSVEVFDFGVVPQHGEVSHVYWLRNTGDEALVIKDIIPNCGCSEAPIEKKRVEPGDSTRVEMTFGSSTYQGEVKKFAQIVSNAQGRVPALTFAAYVVADSEDTGPLEAAPRAINLDKEPVEEVETGGWVSRITLRNNGDSPIELSTIDKPDRDIVIDDFNGTLNPGQEHDLMVHFTGDLPELMFSRSVTFQVADSARSRLTVPIFKTVRWGPASLRTGSAAGQGG